VSEHIQDYPIDQPANSISDSYSPNLVEGPSRHFVSSILNSLVPIRVEVSPDLVQSTPAPRHLATRLDTHSLNLSLEISRIQIPAGHRITQLRFRALGAGDRVSASRKGCAAKVTCIAFSEVRMR
jgi:hypothetical protein